MMEAVELGGRSMTQAEISQLSNQELSDLTKLICQQTLKRHEIVTPLAIPGHGERPIGFLVSTPQHYDPPSEEYWVELRRRMADPNATFLTVDEFLDALDDHWSKADSIAGQFDSTNGHRNHVG
jgi:hypothetical protein